MIIGGVIGGITGGLGKGLQNIKDAKHLKHLQELGDAQTLPKKDLLLLVIPGFLNFLTYNLLTWGVVVLLTPLD